MCTPDREVAAVAATGSLHISASRLYPSVVHMLFLCVFRVRQRLTFVEAAALKYRYVKRECSCANAHNLHHHHHHQGPLDVQGIPHLIRGLDNHPEMLLLLPMPVAA